MTRQRRSRDERGATLLITLMAVVFIATVFTAIATSENTTFRAQRVLADKRAVDLAADGAIDATIARLQTDLEAGTYDSSNAAALGQPCSGLPDGVNYSDAKLGTDNVVVTCHPANNQSRKTSGSGGRPPPNVIRLTGGSTIDGNDSGEGRNNLPFCDDRGNANGDCESGLYIGGTSPGGLLVRSNGANGTAPLVMSNGALVAQSPGADGLKVEGSVLARRACPNVTGGYNLDLSAGTGTAPVNLTSGSASLWCGGKDGATDAGVPNSLLQSVPVWKHNLWNNGSFDNAPAEQTVGDWDKELESPPFKGSTTPPGIARCADRFMKFKPGTYRDLANLNNLMSFCPDGTTYYFSPGTYYFDFNNVNVDPHSWVGPTKFAQIIGGTAQGWTAAVGAQPAKRMQVDDVTSSGPVATPTGGIKIDGDTARLQVTPSPPGNASISQGTLSDPLPESGESITKVEFRLSQTTTTSSPSDPGPTVKIITGGASCQFPALGATHTVAADGTFVYNITNVCPPTPGNPSATTSSAWPPAWTAKKVNALGATLSVARYASGSTITTDLDGMDYDVTYSGQPSPPYPGGCDPKADGVQFIFGDLSRMKFVGTGVYVELCGSEGVSGTSPYATAVYGLTPETTGPARTLSSDVADGNGQIFTEIDDSYNGTTWPNWQQVIGKPPFGKDPSGAGVDAGRSPWSRTHVNSWEHIESPGAPVDSTYTSWSDGTAQTFLMYLDANWIPDGSTIEKVEIDVAHAEPRVKYVAASGFTDNVPSPLVPAPILSVDAGSLTTTFDPDPATNVVNKRLSDANSQTIVYNTGAPFDPLHYPGPYVLDTVDVTKNLRTAAALRHARIGLTYKDSAADTHNKWAFIDGIEVHITYRPPQDLRPLRGCTTIRLAPSGGSPAAPLDLTNWKGVDQVDALRPVSTDTAYYIDNSTSGYHDNERCPLMVVNSNSNGDGSKMHIAGSVYAPTAAFEYAGKENESQFITDGIVARHISTVRWTKAPSLPAFGGDNSKTRTAGEVILEARYKGKLIATAKVLLRDPPIGQARADAVVEAWRRRS